MANDAFLNISELRTEYLSDTGWFEVLHGIDLSVSRGERIGIVGESGCGKSTLARSISRINDEGSTRYTGSIKLGDREVLECRERELRAIRGRQVGMIFQDPLHALNPVFTIGAQLSHAMNEKGRESVLRRCVDLLTQVGLDDPETRIRQYPHQLSGGQRQRVVIAIALARDPEMLIADEPTTALDVTTQREILDLLMRLSIERDMALVVITHDLAVISRLCTRVLVMYLGWVVEDGVSERLFKSPRHPYTQGLLCSVPGMVTTRDSHLKAIPGAVPMPGAAPPGCPFAERCSLRVDSCEAGVPELFAAGGGHYSRCFRMSDARDKVAVFEECGSMSFRDDSSGYGAEDVDA